MKSYDYEAVIYDSTVLCVECLPKGVSVNSEDVTPIFASDEWDRPPCCDKCGCEHDYMGILLPDPDEIFHGCFCGLRGLEISMTREQAESASHQGSCDADVAILVKNPAIAAQLNAFDPDEIRDALREYGAWEDEELSDDEQNRHRAVWSAANDIRENLPR